MERSAKARLSRGQAIPAFVFISLLFALFTAPAATGAEFFWTTSFNISEEYDDNIFLDNEDPVADFITMFSEDFTLGIRTEEIETSIDFSIGYAFYQERESSGDFRTNLNLNGFKDIPISDNWLLNIDEFFNISEDPIELSPTGPEGIPEENYNTRESRNRYIRNNFRGQLSYMFGEEDSFYWGYGNRLLINSDPEIADSMQHEPFAGINYWFNVSHGINLNLSYALATFDKTEEDADVQNASSDFEDLTASATYYFRISPETMWNLSYSITDKDFSDEGESDYKVHNASLGVSHQFTEDLLVSANVGFFKQVSDIGTSTDGLNSGLSLTKYFENSTLTINGSTGFDEQYFDAFNLGANEFTRIRATYSFMAAEGLSVNMGAGYTENKYLELGLPRKDQTWHGNASLSYQLTERLRTSLTYTHQDRASDQEEENYTVNRVMLRLSIPYEGKPTTF